jgi:protein ImuB
MACLWLPSWPIQRCVAARPELRCQRVVLFHQDSRRGRLVAAASPLGMQAGVREGMPLSEAKSLLQRASRVRSTDRTPASLSKPPAIPPDHSQTNTSSFFIFEHDPVADHEALNQLADSLSAFSPIVGLEQADLPAGKIAGKTGEKLTDKLRVSSIFLDLTGLARLFGSESQLAADLFHFVQSLDYVPRLAIANTIGVAWGISHFATEAGTGWRIIATDDPQTFLQLPIESLRLSPHTISLLRQLGIGTNSQLWQLSRNDLAMRFGDEIARRIDQASGSLSEPVMARQQTCGLVAQQLLDYPTNHRETIEVILSRLVGQLCQQLCSRQQGGLQWSVVLGLVNALPLRLMISLFQASANPREVMALIEMQLEQHLGRSNRPNRHGIQVQEVRVAVTSSVLVVPSQRLLFDEAPQLNRQALAQLINRLTSRLGQQHVVYPQLLSGAQPEFSYRFRPLVDIHRRRRSAGKLPSQSHVTGRPLRIFNPAIEIEIEIQTGAITFPSFSSSSSSHPTTPHSPTPHPTALTVPSPGTTLASPLPMNSDPTTIFANHAVSEFMGSRGSGGEGKRAMNRNEQVCGSVIDWQRGLELSIVQAIGPERIETGWWRGQTVCRDYWRVEIETGQSLWIYRDLRQKRWFLQGEF